MNRENKTARTRREAAAAGARLYNPREGGTDMTNQTNTKYGRFALRKIMAWALTFAMLLGTMPFSAIAEPGGEPPDASVIIASFYAVFRDCGAGRGAAGRKRYHRVLRGAARTYQVAGTRRRYAYRHGGFNPARHP